MLSGGTDVTFGFHTVVNIAIEVIDRIHSTVASHGLCMFFEIMGNKSDWLTLYADMTSNTNVILLPKIPYNLKTVAGAIERHADA